ncbi:MAG: dihydrofolate reductase family protein [Candidatus Taylorbacteria bacterium]|nr:dihydrofolate reductase family protein [Candidatus Taylorbacteria bacterium]
MNCFIISCLTADGYIGKNSAHAATWTSKEDKKRFIEITKRAGVVVMGQNTWFTIGRPLKDRLNIVYSPTPIENLPEGVEITMKSPADLLKELEERGFKEVAICGGSQIYTMFMKSGLVNKLYLTIEPVVFGDGIKLFKEDMNQKLKLDKIESTPGGTVLLDYSVVNNEALV